MKPTINYNGQVYVLSTEDEDKYGAGSTKDLADDFAFDVATDMKLRYGSDEFNIATRIIRRAVYALIKENIINVFIPSSIRNMPLLLPPQNQEVAVWLS